MNIKNCIIIHGCPSDKEKAMDPEKRTYDKHWIPWTKRELEKRGIKTDVPLMPESWAPVYEEFKKEFEKLDVNEETVLIGHSCGNTFLARWLSDTKRKVAKLLMVAPWKINESASELEKEFYTFPIDSTISERVGDIVMFTSNDEAEDGKKGLEIFYNALGGEIINLPNHGHYCLGHSMKSEEFPELVEIVLR